jgi:hypothetical protein
MSIDSFKVATLGIYPGFSTFNCALLGFGRTLNTDLEFQCEYIAPVGAVDFQFPDNLCDEVTEIGSLVLYSGIESSSDLFISDPIDLETVELYNGIESSSDLFIPDPIDLEIVESFAGIESSSDLFIPDPIDLDIINIYDGISSDLNLFIPDPIDLEIVESFAGIDSTVDIFIPDPIDLEIVESFAGIDSTVDIFIPDPIDLDIINVYKGIESSSDLFIPDPIDLDTVELYNGIELNVSFDLEDKIIGELVISHGIESEVYIHINDINLEFQCEYIAPVGVVNFQFPDNLCDEVTEIGSLVLYSGIDSELSLVISSIDNIDLNTVESFVGIDSTTDIVIPNNIDLNIIASFNGSSLLHLLTTKQKRKSGTENIEVFSVKEPVVIEIRHNSLYWKKILPIDILKFDSTINIKYKVHPTIPRVKVFSRFLKRI